MKLLEFPHSHYCETARWAMDYKSVDYHREALLPGLHYIYLARIAPRSTVPILINGDRIVQGSREIMDYCDAKFIGPRLMPDDETDAKIVEEIERHADENIGIPLRAIMYSRLLDDRPAVQQCFMQGSPNYKHLIFRAMYPVTKRVIRWDYSLSKNHIETAKIKFDREIGRLDEMIAERQFLVGDRLTRADIMVASMLSIGVLPKEHPVNWPQINDRELISFREQYLDRPIFNWARQLYSRYRNPVLPRTSRIS